MAIDLNKKTPFGNEGFLIARNNPDGTPITPDRVLGFLGTVDLSDYSAGGHDAYLGMKIDDGTELVHEVDWTIAVNYAAVTVAEMVVAINNVDGGAGFADISASTDATTGRLLIAYTGAGDPNFLQVFSVETHPEFAAELDFGQGQDFGGEGAMFLECFDSSKSFGLPKEIKDKEVIENESGDGTFISVVLNAITKGINPVIVMTDEDFRITQLIQGGEWDTDTSQYLPPFTSQTRFPIFSLYIYSLIYSKGQNKKEDEAGYRELKLLSCTGIEADETLDAKTLAEKGFNVSATEWIDESDVKHTMYEKKNLTSDEFIALDVEDIEPVTSNDT